MDIVKSLIRNSFFTNWTFLVICVSVFFVRPQIVFSEVNIQTLFEVTIGKAQATSLDQAELLEFSEKIKKDLSIWPMQIFLLAEVYRLRGNNELAKKSYTELIEWTLTNPYSDGFGGTSLASISLWRLLLEYNQMDNPNPEKVRKLLNGTSQLTKLRLPQGLFEVSPLLPSLPQFEEDILWHSHLLAKTIGDETISRKLLFDYLKITSNWDSVSETILNEEIIAPGLASEEHLKLFRGKRLLDLKIYDEKTKELLNDAYQSNNIHISSEAGFHLASLITKLMKSEKDYNQREDARKEIIEILNNVTKYGTDDELRQRSYLELYFTYNRRGEGRDVKAARKSLQNLIDEYPEGFFINEAYYRLADNFARSKEYGLALDYYQKLRDHVGVSEDWKNSSFYNPAIILYTRGKDRDIQKAIKILQELEKEKPTGDLHLRALFWLGRMYEETGHNKQAEKYFKQVISDSPFQYYAIRAHIHLNLGNKAKELILPDDKTKRQLSREYLKSKDSKSQLKLLTYSPYHLRLNHILNSGIYANAVGQIQKVRQQFPDKRLEDISLLDLDRNNLLVPMTVLISVRQDALLASDLVQDPQNSIEISTAIGEKTQDWPFALSLIFTNNTYNPERAALHQNDSYLATAYPTIYKDFISKYSELNQVRSSMLYGLMRQESLFYAQAISLSNAKGLFQFVPITFNSLNKKWNLLGNNEWGNVDNMEELLFNEELSIKLGAKWVKEVLLKQNDGNLVWAVMEHNAGHGPVKGWKTKWQKEGRENDVEYMIETAGYAATRNLARSVLTDIAVVESTDIFQNEEYN